MRSKNTVAGEVTFSIADNYFTFTPDRIVDGRTMVDADFVLEHFGVQQSDLYLEIAN